MKKNKGFSPVCKKKKRKKENTTIIEVRKWGNKIMTKISDFATKQNAHNDKIDIAVTGLTADIDALNAEIAKLQASGGDVSAEDQASLDAIEARGQAISDKLTALDALTPPAVPVV